MIRNGCEEDLNTEAGTCCSVCSPQTPECQAVNEEVDIFVAGFPCTPFSQMRPGRFKVRLVFAVVLTHRFICFTFAIWLRAMDTRCERNVNIMKLYVRICGYTARLLQS